MAVRGQELVLLFGQGKASLLLPNASRGGSPIYIPPILEPRAVLTQPQV